MRWHFQFLLFLVICVWANGGLPENPADLNAKILEEMGFSKGKDGYMGQKNQEGEFHGMGILHFPAGGVYAGEWKRGMKHGKGKAVMESGDTYIGDWKFDRQHGEGILLTSDGDKYTGKWKFGEQDGEGEYRWAGGNYYVGEWSESEPHGFGEAYEAQPQQKYKGEWRNGKRHGRGTITRTTDSKILFEGMFENDKPVKQK
eukprot:Phypoly_transcript_19671.p1 GENE.Phypoly_transcript_19671~~Phypoly_transcript_19671.p1  ORF type:complete len:225 (+),score=33.90 Phypoly_transcript_19671:74-676(+)